MTAAEAHRMFMEAPLSEAERLRAVAQSLVGCMRRSAEAVTPKSPVYRVAPEAMASYRRRLAEWERRLEAEDATPESFLAICELRIRTLVAVHERVDRDLQRGLASMLAELDVAILSASGRDVTEAVRESAEQVAAELAENLVGTEGMDDVPMIVVGRGLRNHVVEIRERIAERGEASLDDARELAYFVSLAMLDVCVLCKGKAREGLVTGFAVTFGRGILGHFGLGHLLAADDD